MNLFFLMRFEVLILVTVKIIIFWNISHDFLISKETNLILILGITFNLFCESGLLSMKSSFEMFNYLKCK